MVAGIDEENFSRFKTKGLGKISGERLLVSKVVQRYELVIRKAIYVKEFIVRLPKVINFYKYFQKICVEGVHVCSTSRCVSLEKQG